MNRIIRRLETEPMTRIVALGSSNTAKGYHCAGQYNWFDWLDVGLSQHYGRVHHTVNAGVSGQTTRDLLARFERDVALYQPHVVIITVGGNDCNPDQQIDIDEFRANLTELVARSEALENCVAILQTYYAIDVEQMPDEPERARTFAAYMQAIGQVAETARCLLYDHFTRWERLRKADVDAYRRLMRDPMHLSPLGNMVLGLDDVRYFGAAVVDEIADVCTEGLHLQKVLDALGRRER
jgi:lysophospholipase L1-like esterase